MTFLNTSSVTSSLDMTVYSKTNAGRLMAFKPKPGLPVALKDLLILVDGKTPYQELVRRPGDAELFEELQLRQLVQIAPEPWRNSSAPIARQHNNATEQPRPRLSLVDGSSHNSKIQAIKALMAGFVNAHLHQHVEIMLAEIDALTNEAQLLCMFSGYMHAVNATGGTGQRHVQELLVALTDQE